MKGFYNKLTAGHLKLRIVKFSPHLLIVCAILDASFIPLPVITFYFSLLLISRERQSGYLFSVLAGSLAGSIVGYSCGLLLSSKVPPDSIAKLTLILERYSGIQTSTSTHLDIYDSRLGIYALIAAAFTPIPYGVFAITSGFLKLNFFSFCLATLTGFAVKYCIILLVAGRLGAGVSYLLRKKWIMPFTKGRLINNPSTVNNYPSGYNEGYNPPVKKSMIKRNYSIGGVKTIKRIIIQRYIDRSFL